MRDFTRRHLYTIHWYASIAGMAGIGHWRLATLDLHFPGAGLLTAVGFTLVRACAKLYLFHVAAEQQSPHNS